MQKNLVIVESPAKAKTIEKFLGSDFKVMSSYGHIRDLKKNELSIDTDSLKPFYEIPKDKIRVVRELKDNAKKVDTVWLASDEDREGEAISWHLCEVLGLDEKKTARIVFHEITEKAIIEAIQHPRCVDMRLVNAQQARRLLDRLVGFLLSPVLWRKIRPSLSAGRVQSVAVRLVVDREREIRAFKSELYYRISAVFITKDEGEGSIKGINAELSTRFKIKEEAVSFLESLKNAEFVVENVTRKLAKRAPLPPFTTSTLQQEAVRRLGFSVNMTMSLAQHLYENGHITYMRTDSVNLSSLCLSACKSEIIRLYGKEYSREKNYHTNTKGAQEAHEAIRPTHMDVSEITGTPQEKSLYRLIWEHTMACQMADAEIEKTSVTIKIKGKEQENKYAFVTNGEVITFDGFLKIGHKKDKNDGQQADIEANILPPLVQGQVLSYKEIHATERFTQAPSRYTEANLVHKLEELGIGRPSTYAPTISTILQREYVKKGENKGEERAYDVYSLRNGVIEKSIKMENTKGDKGKLMPTDTGTVVNDYLMEYFPNIMDYNFTANVESKFDDIAMGSLQWTNMIREFFDDFKPTVEEAMNTRLEHRIGERLLGNDPSSNNPVYVKIGRYGPMIQIGDTSGGKKPLFAQVPTSKSIETITLEEALEQFKMPRDIGEYEGDKVRISSGRYGPYILNNKKYISIPKGIDPLTITLESAINIIEEKKEKEAQRKIKDFGQQSSAEILKGRFGPYISYDGKNYPIPKNKYEKVAEMTLQECLEIIKNTPEKKSKRK